jgi:hypothetical protein
VTRPGGFPYTQLCQLSAAFYRCAVSAAGRSCAFSTLMVRHLLWSPLAMGEHVLQELCASL